MTRLTEPQLRQIVASGQWFTSWSIAAALILSILRAPVPDWLVSLFSWGIGISAPSFLVVGMALAWRLPDWRRWLALVANLFLIVCGILLLNFVVESDRAASSEAMANSVKNSAEYLAVFKSLTANQAEDAGLVKDIADMPRDWVTQKLRLGARRSELAATMTAQTARLAEMEKTAPVAKVSASSAFDIFGKQYDGIVLDVVALILAVANEAIGLALAWNGEKVNPKREEKRESEKRAASEKAEQPEESPRLTPEEEEEKYLDMARVWGKDGQGAGYRVVAEKTGWSEYRTRNVRERLVQKGKIRIQAS